MREELAKLAHEQWSGWMKHMFEQCRKAPRGTLIIPSWAVVRWTEQMNTPYDKLSEQEKDSDRKEADRFLAILENV